LHGLGGALGHDLEDLLGIQGGRQAARHVVERAGLALAPLGGREEARVAHRKRRLPDQGVEHLALLHTQVQRPGRRE
jgi:hypothetical protein